MVLLQPAAILIDHGHFQYNNISLGFAVRATSSANFCAWFSIGPFPLLACSYIQMQHVCLCSPGIWQLQCINCQPATKNHIVLRQIC